MAGLRSACARAVSVSASRRGASASPWLSRLPRHAVQTAAGDHDDRETDTTSRGPGVRGAVDAAADHCASCGEPAHISPRLRGTPRDWALRDQGWLSLPAPKPDGPPLPQERPLLCPHCLVAPPPRALELLTSLGISPDAFVNLKPPARKPRRNKAPRPTKPLMRKCSSCGRWLEASQEWIVRLGAELRPGPAKLTPKERALALWYCGSPGCQAEARRRALQHGKEGA